MFSFELVKKDTFPNRHREYTFLAECVCVVDFARHSHDNELIVIFVVLLVEQVWSVPVTLGTGIVP